MYAVIVTFVLSVGQGEAITDPRFATMEQCEAARPAIVEMTRDIIESVHGPVQMTSHCGLADELDGQDV